MSIRHPNPYRLANLLAGMTALVEFFEQAHGETLPERTRQCLLDEIDHARRALAEEWPERFEITLRVKRA